MIHNLKGSDRLNAAGSFPVKRTPYAQFSGIRGNKEKIKRRHDIPGLERCALGGQI
jgi:hypothetical protein